MVWKVNHWPVEVLIQKEPPHIFLASIGGLPPALIVVHVVDPFHAERKSRSSHPHRDPERSAMVNGNNQNSQISILIPNSWTKGVDDLRLIPQQLPRRVEGGLLLGDGKPAWMTVSPQFQSLVTNQNLVVNHIRLNSNGIAKAVAMSRSNREW